MVIDFEWDEIKARINEKSDTIRIISARRMTNQEREAMNDEDTLRPEYSADLIQSGQRGKYAQRYREGTNIALIEPDLHKLFPNSEAVNRALRKYAEERKMASI